MIDLQPCRKAGIELTWRCNQRCIHCYYRRNRNLGRSIDKPLEDAVRQVDEARERGCDHIYFVGWGEPALYPEIEEIVKYCRDLGLPTSMITNGAVPLKIYERLFDLGLDHVHLSTHAVNDVHDEIAGLQGAYKRQRELKRWLSEHDLPWRSNTTVMQKNYRMLPEIIEEALEFDIFHFVLLTFLPHYEWKRHVHDMAVHPEELAPYLEQALDLLLRGGTWFTLRYFPFCHLQPKYWRWVVNAYYVQFDPWEWEYGQYNKNDIRSSWRGARALRKNVRVETCEARCLAWRHCGGWNRNYCNAFGGDTILKPITEIPEMYKDQWDCDGGLHVLNPANLHSGTIQDGRLASAVGGRDLEASCA